jgi:hypothetical protein
MSTATLKKYTNAHVQRLQDDVESIVRDTIAPTLAEIVAKAAASAVQGSNQAREYSETVASGVRSRPLISILVTAAVSFVAGRMSAGGKRD